MRIFYDKFTEIYDVIIKENGSLDNRILNLQSKIEKIEEEHRIEFNVYKDKIRALDYEHQLAVHDLSENNSKKLRDEDS